MKALHVMTDPKNHNPAIQTPDQRVQTIIEGIFGDAAAAEARLDTIIAEAVRQAIATERENCARLIDGIKDEYIEWCVLNRLSTPEQMHFATLLTKIAASIRGHVGRP